MNLKNNTQFSAEACSSGPYPNLQLQREKTPLQQLHLSAAKCMSWLDHLSLVVRECVNALVSINVVYFHVGPG